MAAVDRPPESASDETLVARAREGDRAAFDGIVTRYQERLFMLAERLADNPSDAEEVLQESFLRAYRSLSGFRGEAQGSTWLYRIVVNTSLRKRRSIRRHPVESLDALLPRFNCDGRLERLDLDYGSGARAEEVLERKELAEKARAAIDLLPEGIRAAFVLHDLEGLSTKEAAEVLGIEPGALRTRLHRARLVLRAYLGKITGGA